MSPGLKMILGLVLRGLIRHSSKDKGKKQEQNEGKEKSFQNEEKGGEN